MHKNVRKEHPITLVFFFNCPGTNKTSLVKVIKVLRKACLRTRHKSSSRNSIYLKFGRLVKNGLFAIIKSVAIDANRSFLGCPAVVAQIAKFFRLSPFPVGRSLFALAVQNGQSPSY